MLSNLWIFSPKPLILFLVQYASLPLSSGRYFLRTPNKWMTETADITKLYASLCFPVHTYLWQRLIYKVDTLSVILINNKTRTIIALSECGVSLPQNILLFCIHVSCFVMRCESHSRQDKWEAAWFHFAIQNLKHMNCLFLQFPHTIFLVFNWTWIS